MPDRTSSLEIAVSQILPLIVEAQELQPLLEDTSILVVDLSKPGLYYRAHIPGAVHLNARKLVSGIPPATGMLPSSQALSTVLAEIGYDKNIHIVACDDEGGGWASRFLWILEVIGHGHFSLLNGGLHAWLRGRFPVESRPSTAKQDTNEVTTEPVINDTLVVTKDEILEGLGKQRFTLWDTRTIHEYRGEMQFARRGGHIPGAVHLEWSELINQQNHFRIRHDASELLTMHGITHEREIITYCQTHHRSALAWLVAKSLGYSVRAYAGSWSEWGNCDDTPVASLETSEL